MRQLPINCGEMVQELHQVLLEREATCHKTCFSLQLNGVSLDNFTEIRAIPDLVDGSVLHVVEEPYTLREARVHIRHVRDLLRHTDQAEAASAVEMTSLSFLTSVNLQERGDKEKPFDGLPPEYVVPGTKERSLAPMLAHSQKAKPAIRNMGISSFNPPPGHRKVKGDVLYIYVDTVEKRRLHITCCTKGFFVNSSTDEVFNAQPSNQNKAIYHSLVDLLNVLSPGFKKIYPTLIKKRNERHMLDRLPTPYPVHSWLSPVQEVVEDSIRADDSSQPHRVGFEDHLPGQIRDWNEELQTTHEMARANLQERVTRDRSVFKIHGDFIGAAIKGAMAVVDGNVMAINPADEPRTHMFIWNNIFFSLGFDVKDHYKELGGDAAAFAATSADLQGVRAYAALDNCKLCTLGMAIIDYRGYRVTAQSIIPGILDKEQEQSVVYGSVDFGKTVVSSEKYHELLEASAKELKLLPHEVVIDEHGNTAKLFTSYETKGIIGNDGRYYVLDLLRTMPPDVHYLQDAEVSERSKELGFPRKFPHKLATLRQEFVEIFHEARCMQFIKTAANHVRQHIVANKENNEAGEFPFRLSLGFHYAEILGQLQAAEAVHSLRADTFDIRFNPDCFSSTVKHAPGEDLEKQRRLVVEAAEFLVTSQLPEFVSSCVDSSVTPIDGESLCDLMHARGINVRYLGDVMRTVRRVSSIQFTSSTGLWIRHPFTEDDIQNLIPVTKHRQPCASDAKKLFARGQQAMQVGHLREAYECIAESVNLMTSVYGALHSELAQALRLLARLSYILGDPTEAVAQQHRAALMSERCNGIDHAYTIIEYINLAHFAFSNLYIPAALRLLYRARYLLLIAHGENHPLMAQIDGNIGVILFAVHEFDTALRFLQSSEAVMTANGEPKRLKSALVQHITARAHASRGDFRAALAAEKETYSIYNNLFGAEHDKTKESSEYLSQLTMQAVAFQRKVMDATKGNSVGPLLPAQVSN
ncbi:unnamed protein product [Heligmosomoides polygyrus]|uniref:Clu domain-containing protein n=1 Tax=Heligmosomoides polygyrus TaxID=6339 RepID=A0A3P8A488_HELPZ|nr:unnamed protein product [Heligmosomoides polygyrus]